MKPKSTSFMILLSLAICFGTLLTFATLFNASVEAAPVLQATATCAPQSTPTPVPSCPGENPAPVLGRQPHPTAMRSAFIDAGLNRLGSNSPTLPLIWRGYGTQARQVAPYAPCILLEAMAYTESTGWKQFNAAHGECGFTKIGVDPTPGTCGYGAMQITSGMGGGAGFDPNLVVADYRYGIGTGAKILIDKWNSRYSQGYRVGENDPGIVEDWYYAVWAYNGFSWINNPNNENRYPPQDIRGTWLCGADPGQDRNKFPYQELVWGCAANPPNNDYWVANQLSLPSDSEVFNGQFQPPLLLLNRPAPYHTSCGVNYLPIIMKNWIGVPCNTYTTLWYPVGTNTCNPTVSNCAQGDGQPDNVWAGPWSIGYHQVEFSPQLVLANTQVGAYWKSVSGVYGNLYIDAKLNGAWTRVHTSLYQSSTGRWEQIGLGSHTDKYLSGLRFGFSSTMGVPGGPAHQFMVDGYRIMNFMACGN